MVLSMDEALGNMYQVSSNMRKQKQDQQTALMDTLLKKAQMAEAGYDIQGNNIVQRPDFVSLKQMQARKTGLETDELQQRLENEKKFAAQQDTDSPVAFVPSSPGTTPLTPQPLAPVNNEPIITTGDTPDANVVGFKQTPRPLVSSPSLGQVPQTPAAPTQGALTTPQKQYKWVLGPDGKYVKEENKDYIDPYKKDTMDFRKKLDKEKRVTAFQKALDPSAFRAGQFATSKLVFDRAERLESLASSVADGNLDRRQIEELAIGINSMLSGSNTGAQEQVRSLLPQSLAGNTMKLKEWLTGNPTGMEQQNFVHRLVDTIRREKATASEQMKRTMMTRIPAYRDVEQNDPELFKETLMAQGIDPAEYESWKKGGFKSISAVQQSDSGEDFSQFQGAVPKGARIKKVTRVA